MTHSPELPIKAHAVASGLTIATGSALHSTSSVLRRGDELLIDRALVQANTDRTGRCPVLELLDDEPAQAAVWGRVMVRRGPWPDGESRIEPGSAEWSDAREAARQAAHAIEDETDRARALAAVREEYGDVPTSKTLLNYSR